MRYNAALMLALAASERREIVVIDESRTGNHIRKLLEVPEPVTIVPDLETMQAEAIRKAAGAYIGEPWTLPGHPIVKGRVLEQAKGPNRAADRARGIYGKRGKR